VKLSEFDYELPGRLIAQEPLPRRDASRLMVVDRARDEVVHRSFADLPSLLRAGDLLVLNDTLVVPARLHGAKPTGWKVEVLLLERIGGSDEEPVHRCLLDASKPARRGARIEFGNGLAARVLGRSGEGYEIALLSSGGDPAETFHGIGSVPLPPYIRRVTGDPREALDRERYQTVYAARPGAVAAPTAGLHFTRALLEEIASRGVGIERLTLHVGPGTFLPVRVENVEEHAMEPEAYDLPGATAEAVRGTRRSGGRVVAVGTTVVRTLEAAAEPGGTVRAGAGRCDLFIRPGHVFRVVDALVTNFHLPRSTLLMLVCAFAGRERVLAAYAEAVRSGYRFYSYRAARWRPQLSCRSGPRERSRRSRPRTCAHAGRRSSSATPTTSTFARGTSSFVTSGDSTASCTGKDRS
jgi:S-adenosylmethionine:tRNA ribosyltransferase-isomerase